MCGLAGFVSSSGFSVDHLRQIAKSMADTLRHRGPNDSGEWVSESDGVAFGFRRLSIIDLSPAGHQPMVSASGRYVMIFNGEAYNFERLRDELRKNGEAGEFRGHSDTEVILAAIEAWGLRRAVRSLVGMFAFAVWDREERRLHLVRDRLGVKPLYFTRAGQTFLFASELKAIRAYPAFNPQIDRDAVADFLRFSYIPAPQTIYRGVSKLLPGTILTWDKPSGHMIGPEPYWSAREVVESSLDRPFTGSEADATSELDTLLRDAIGLRMISDVPLGVFLSGGVDSSVVTALMQAQSHRPVKTFTIGFESLDYDEASDARRVAAHLGTEHTELYMTGRDALEVIPKLPRIYDEPFSDSSQIPTHLISLLAGKYVTVSLSGDGGDEVFGGYNRYVWVERFWRAMHLIPRSVRSGVSRLVQVLPPAIAAAPFRLTGAFVSGFAVRTPEEKAQKIGAILPASSANEMYRILVTGAADSASLVRGARVDREEQIDLPHGLGTVEQMMYLDLITYLPDDILVKVDRASMAVSLEVREPLLDHRIIEFAWKLPLHFKVRGGDSKWILRQVLHRYVPPSLIDRPKTGFSIPLHQWLRNELRDWAESLLDQSRLDQQEIFDVQTVRRWWREHLSGRHRWHHRLWDVLMFQAWLEEQTSESNSQSFRAPPVLAFG